MGINRRIHECVYDELSLDQSPKSIKLAKSHQREKIAQTLSSHSKSSDWVCICYLIQMNIIFRRFHTVQFRNEIRVS